MGGVVGGVRQVKDTQMNTVARLHDCNPLRPSAPLTDSHPSSHFLPLSLHLPEDVEERTGKHLALGETYVFVTSLAGPGRLQQNVAAVYLDVEGDSFTQI